MAVPRAARRGRARVPAAVVGLSIAFIAGVLIVAAVLATSDSSAGGVVSTPTATAPAGDGAAAPGAIATTTVRPPSPARTPTPAGGPPGRDKKPPGKEKN